MALDVNSRCPLEVSSTQVPNTLVSGQKVFSQPDSGDTLASWSLMLWLLHSVLKLGHSDRTPTCYLFVCFQCKLVQFIPVS